MKTKTNKYKQMSNKLIYLKQNMIYEQNLYNNKICRIYGTIKQ